MCVALDVVAVRVESCRWVGECCREKVYWCWMSYGDRGMDSVPVMGTMGFPSDWCSVVYG